MPPVAVRLKEKLLFFFTSQGEVVVIAGAALIVMENAFVVVPAGVAPSATVMFAVNGPAVVGTPLRTPVELLIVRPGGRFVALQLYEPKPPVAAIVVFGYARPTVQAESGEAVLITSFG